MTASSSGELEAALVLRSVYAQDGQAWLRSGAGVVEQSGRIASSRRPARSSSAWRRSSSLRSSQAVMAREVHCDRRPDTLGSDVLDVLDVVGIGFGPANLAVAVVLEELAESGTALGAAFGKQTGFSWHPE